MSGSGHSFGPATVVAILAAAGLGIWSAERAADALGIGAVAAGDGHASTAAGAQRATERRRPPSSAPVRHVPSPALTFGGAADGGVQLKGGALPDPGAPGEPVAAGGGALSEAERTAALLLDRLARVLRDLEWTPGLPEPRQQTVIPPPDPWRPPASAASAPSPVIEAIEPGTGPAAGGAQITIRGKHLRPASVVFGHLPAQIVSASADAVVVVAPRAGAGEVDVAITNDDGTFAIAARRFTYAAPHPAPSP